MWKHYSVNMFVFFGERLNDQCNFPAVKMVWSERTQWRFASHGVAPKRLTAFLKVEIKIRSKGEFWDPSLKLKAQNSNFKRHISTLGRAPTTTCQPSRTTVLHFPQKESVKTTTRRKRSGITTFQRTLEQTTSEGLTNISLFSWTLKSATSQRIYSILQLYSSCRLTSSV